MPGHRSTAGTDSIIVERRLGFLEAEVPFAQLSQGPLWGESGHWLVELWLEVWVNPNVLHLAWLKPHAALIKRL